LGEGHQFSGKEILSLQLEGRMERGEIQLSGCSTYRIHYSDEPLLPNDEGRITGKSCEKDKRFLTLH